MSPESKLFDLANYISNKIGERDTVGTKQSQGTNTEKFPNLRKSEELLMIQGESSREKFRESVEYTDSLQRTSRLATGG